MRLTDDERKEFERRFTERRSIFENAITAIDTGFGEFEWILYRDREEVMDDGDVLYEAKMESGPHPSKAELLEYVCFVIDQGFHVEVAFDYSPGKIRAHVVSWEKEYGPDWPDELEPAVSLRWDAVNSDLGARA